MIRTYEISATRPDPVRPGQKLPVGPTDPRPFGEREHVAEWFGSLCWPTAALLEAGLVGLPLRYVRLVFVGLPLRYVSPGVLPSATRPTRRCSPMSGW